MTRWTEQDVRAITHRLGEAIKAPFDKPPLSPRKVMPLYPAQKYRNEHCIWQGLKFDSKKELDDYKAFKLQEAAGVIRSVVRQVSFPLQGSTRRIRIDFMVVELSGALRWYDSKGFATDTWLLKQKLVRDAYGIEIEVI